MKEKKIALSLPFGYLSGQSSEIREAILTKTFGSPENALPSFRELISAIEISNFDEDAAPEAIIQAVQTIREAGLETILHAHLPETISGTCMNDVYPWFEDVLTEIEAHQPNLMINIHTLSSDTRGVAELQRKTIDNLKKMNRLLEKLDYPVFIAAELNRQKGTNDPSTGYENLIQIYREIDSSRIGIGWDFGHTYSNVLNGLIVKEPPQEFVEGVIHAHIHDLGQGNQTHWPLSVGKIPLSFYLDKLAGAEYTGCYTLELYPERWTDVIQAEKGIMESIEILKRSLK